jgi:hypothetical protein
LVTSYDLISTPGDPTGVIKAGSDLLAADLIETISNFIKMAGRLAADAYGGRYFAGFKRKWSEGAEYDGERTAVWLRRAFAATVVGVPLWSLLLTTFPSIFRPLLALYNFVETWAPTLIHVMG